MFMILYIQKQWLQIRLKIPKLIPEINMKSVLNPLQIRVAACLGFENIDL
jgi:hypothetical protein